MCFVVCGKYVLVKVYIDRYEVWIFKSIFVLKRGWKKCVVCFIDSYNFSNV